MLLTAFAGQVHLTLALGKALAIGVAEAVNAMGTADAFAVARLQALGRDTGKPQAWQRL